MSERNLYYTRLGQSLQPKRLSWADMTEDAEEDGGRDLGMAELARGVYDLVQRSQLDINSPQTAFFHQTEDGTHVNIMVHPSMVVIGLTHRPSDSQREGGEASSEADDTPPPSPSPPSMIDEEEEEEKQPAVPPPAPVREPTPPPPNPNPFAILQEESQDDSEEECLLPKKTPEPKVEAKAVPQEEENHNNDEWTTVASKKKHAGAHKSFYFFRDEANSPFIDFVGVCSTFKEVEERSRKEMLSHAYCPADNQVYDFHRMDDRYVYRVFAPNPAYLTKFEKWESEHQTLDDRVFMVFRDQSKWKTWALLDSQVIGLAAVRDLVKRTRCEWSHAYDPESRWIYEFEFVPGKCFRQKQHPADADYVLRFDQMMSEDVQ